MKGSVFPRAPAAVPGVDCTAEISAQTGVISFSRYSWFAGAQVRKKKNLSAAWLENYFPLAADHQRGYSKQILLHRQRNERTSLASSDIYFYCCCRWNKCKKEREICIRTIKTKQKSNNKGTKRVDKSQGFLPMGVMFLCLQPIHHENNWSWWSFVYSI